MKIWERIRANDKGFTLLEVLVSVVILAMITSPFLGLFVTSAQYTTSSQEIMAATYTGQTLLEELVGLDYASLLAQQDATLREFNGFWVRVRCETSGVHGDLAGGSACYVHVVYTSSGVLLAGPDGAWVTTGTAGTLTLAQTAATYTLSAGAATLAGSKANVPIVLIVNTAAKSGTASITLTVPSGVHVVHYTNSDHKNDLNASGYATLSLYEGVDDYAASLVRVIASVYRSFSSTEPLCVVEDYLRPANE